jgi:hypothetical protein
MFRYGWTNRLASMLADRKAGGQIDRQKYLEMDG